jgi:hypothetical protein
MKQELFVLFKCQMALLYEGHGTNKKLAKYDACSQALNSQN